MLRRPNSVSSVAQLLGGDAVILGAEEQQGHGGCPRKVERLGQNQQHLPVLVEQRAFDHVGRQCAQQRQADRDFLDLVGAGIDARCCSRSDCPADAASSPPVWRRNSFAIPGRTWTAARPRPRPPRTGFGRPSRAVRARSRFLTSSDALAINCWNSCRGMSLRRPSCSARMESPSARWIMCRKPKSEKRAPLLLATEFTTS